MHPSPAATAPHLASGSGSDWFRFAALVPADPALFTALQAAPDADTFATLAARLGAERGFSFSPAHAHAALLAARRSWMERNLS